MMVSLVPSKKAGRACQTRSMYPPPQNETKAWRSSAGGAGGRSPMAGGAGGAPEKPFFTSFAPPQAEQKKWKEKQGAPLPTPARGWLPLATLPLRPSYGHPTLMNADLSLLVVPQLPFLVDLAQRPVLLQSTDGLVNLFLQGSRIRIGLIKADHVVAEGEGFTDQLQRLILLAAGPCAQYVVGDSGQIDQDRIDPTQCQIIERQVWIV